MRLRKCRVDRERVGEGAVNRAGLLDDDLAVALDDGGRDLADVLVDERLDGLFAREDPRARLAHAGGTERIGGSRPAERGTGSFVALHERRRRPLRLKRLRFELSVDRLKHRPREPRAARQRQFDRLPEAHTPSPSHNTNSSHAERAALYGPAAARRCSTGIGGRMIARRITRFVRPAACTSSLQRTVVGLAPAGQRHLVDADDDARNLVRRQPPGAVQADRRQRQIGAVRRRPPQSARRARRPAPPARARPSRRESP